MKIRIAAVLTFALLSASCAEKSNPISAEPSGHSESLTSVAKISHAPAKNHLPIMISRVGNESLKKGRVTSVRIQYRVLRDIQGCRIRIKLHGMLAVSGMDVSKFEESCNGKSQGSIVLSVQALRAGKLNLALNVSGEVGGRKVGMTRIIPLMAIQEGLHTKSMEMNEERPGVLKGKTFIRK